MSTAVLYTACPDAWIGARSATRFALTLPCVLLKSADTPLLLSSKLFADLSSSVSNLVSSRSICSKASRCSLFSLWMPSLHGAHLCDAKSDDALDFQHTEGHCCLIYVVSCRAGMENTWY